MHPLRRLRPLFAVAVAAGVLVTACGGGGSKIAGLAPKDVIRVSSDNLQGRSLRFDMTGRLSVDSSGLTGISAQQMQQLGALVNGLTITGKGEEESPQRLRMQLSLAPLIAKAVTLVVYDGKAYYSEDGTRFAQAGSIKNLTGGVGATPADMRSYLQGLADVRDLGSTTKDGMGVEHYQATLDQSFLTKLLDQSSAQSSASPNPLGGMSALLTQMIHIDHGTIDAYVDPSTAQLDRTTVDMGMTFDLGKLAQIFGGLAQQSGGQEQLPGGSMKIAINGDVHLYDYGASIHVTQPTVDPTAPTPPASSGLFG